MGCGNVDAFAASRPLRMNIFTSVFHVAIDIASTQLVIAWSNTGHLEKEQRSNLIDSVNSNATSAIKMSTRQDTLQA